MDEELLAIIKSSGKGKLAGKNCPYEYHAATDTLKFCLDMQVVNFAAGSDDDEVLDSVKEAFGTRAGSNDDFWPTDDEFKTILSYCNKKGFRKEDFKVFYLTSAGTDLDRHAEKFAPKALQTMADSSGGMPFMLNHDHYDVRAVIGKIFDSKVMRMKAGGKKLCQKVYMRNKPENKWIFDGIEDGTNAKLSVGVRMKRKSLICDLCKNPVYSSECSHYPGQETKDGQLCTATIEDVIEQIEVSLVTIPAQPIGAIKSCGLDEDPSLNEDDSAPPQTKNSITTISPTHTRGDRSVDEDEKNKAEAKPADKPAEDASAADAKPAETTKGDAPPAKPAAVVEVAASAELIKTVEEFKSESASLKTKLAELTSQVDALNKSNAELAEKLTASVEEIKSSTTARVESNEKSLDEVKKVLQVAAKAHGSLTEEVQKISEMVNAVQAKSIQEMVREVASLRLNDKSRTKIAAEKKNGENFYEGFGDHF